MTKLLLVILTFISMSGFSQTNIVKNNNIKIGLKFSPEINLTSTSFSDSRWSFYEMAPTEFNYSTGISGLISIKQSLYIGSGLIYSNKDYIGSYYCAVCDFGFDTESLQMKQRFFEIPLFVRYQIIDGKIGIHGETGLKGSYLLKKIENEYNLEPNSYSSLLSGQIGVGIDIPIGQNIYLTLTTRYSRSLTDFYENSDFRFNTLGIVTSIMYRIENKE